MDFSTPECQEVLATFETALKTQGLTDLTPSVVLADCPNDDAFAQLRQYCLSLKAELSQPADLGAAVLEVFAGSGVESVQFGEWQPPDGWTLDEHYVDAVRTQIAPLLGLLDTILTEMDKSDGSSA